MKTMMKWFVGFACAVAFIAIAFTPSSAAAQYACRPVSRIGPQSIEGPLTLTCSTCSGLPAITIPVDTKLCLDESCGVFLDHSTAAGNLVRVNALYSMGAAAVAGNADLRSNIYNSTAANGGSLAFNDPTRWLSTTTALLESSTTNTATDTAFTMTTLPTNTLAAGDKLLSLQNATVEKFRVDYDGAVVSSSQIVASAFTGNTHQTGGGGSNPLVLKAYRTDDASAVVAQIGNSNALSTAGAKILSLYSDNMTTERAYFDYLGSLTISGTASSTNAITVPAGARIAFGTSSYLYNSVGGTVSSSGGMFANGVIESNSGVKVGPSSATCAAATRGIQRYVEGAAGVADKVEVCMKSAADTYAWAVMFTAP